MVCPVAMASNKTVDGLSSVRDTVESIWVAIVLAFVLRAFMIEAFVIPTGSMAPRLMGEHWGLRCPACGYEYPYGVPKDVARRLRSNGEPTSFIAHCPNCTFRYDVRGKPKPPRNSGDRVLVLKYLYNFREPRPWDVVVFKNPQSNRDNYIKRLVGLPGEEIEIVHGDIFYREMEKGSNEPWHIRRKPRRAQEVMWQVVYDNDYRPDQKRLEKDDESFCPKWAAPDGGKHWDLSGDHGRIFEFKGSDKPAKVVLKADRRTFLPRYGYNPAGDTTNINTHIDICSDLELSFVFVPKADDVRVSLMLSSFEHLFKAELGADGVAKLFYKPLAAEAWDDWGATKIRPLELGRGCEVTLTHVDLSVTLWVDGKAILRSPGQEYPENYRTLKKRLSELGRGDIPLPRIAIAAEGGPCQLRHIRLMRDVYYTFTKLQEVPDGPLGDFTRELKDGKLDSSNPGWGVTGNSLELKKRSPENSDLDEFFVLGDNSPQSLDGRAWTRAAPTLRLWKKDGKILRTYEEEAEQLYHLGTVPRYNLIGRALFVYWPSGFRVPFLPDLPIIPNLGRMRLIR